MNNTNEIKPFKKKFFKKKNNYPNNGNILDEDYYINRTRNVNLSDIFKNKKGLSKTIEKILQKEETRKNMFNILKRRKESIISGRLTSSKTNTKDKSFDSIRDKTKSPNSFDFPKRIGKYTQICQQLNKFSKKNIIKQVSPIANKRNVNNLKVIANNNNINIFNEKNKNYLDFSCDSNEILNKKKNILISNDHLKAQSNKLKYHYKKNKNKRNKLPETKKKIENNNITLKLPEKIVKNNNNLTLDFVEDFTILASAEPKNLLQNNYKEEKRTQIPNNNLDIEYKDSINITSIETKDLLQNNFKEEKCMQISINNQKRNLSDYSGYIIIKKKLGKIEEQFLLDEDENKAKEIFLNIFDEITGEENDFITKNELEIFNIIQEENNVNLKKIKDQELQIQENEKSYLVLKNELEKIILENNKLKERINLLEIKEEEIQKMNESFSEYKKSKKEEIQNLEKKIKKYEDEINKIKDEKNKIKDYNIESLDIFIGKEINNNNIIKNGENNDDNTNIEKDEKDSRVINRIKKNKNNDSNNVKKINNSNIFIKKSEKINKIVKMLEQQMSGVKNKIEKDNKTIKNKDSEDDNYRNLLDGKPINIYKRKTTKKPIFKDE